MGIYTIIMSLGIAIGLVSIISIVAAYMCSSNARKKIEQPKHDMFDADNRLWSKQDGIEE
jgi:hypothetical protein